MAHGLRIRAALSEEPSLVPTTHNACLITVYHSSSRGPLPSSGFCKQLHAPLNSHETYTSVTKNKNTTYFKMWIIV